MRGNEDRPRVHLNSAAAITLSGNRETAIPQHGKVAQHRAA
jgi:hypothetical protein